MAEPERDNKTWQEREMKSYEILSLENQSKDFRKKGEAHEEFFENTNYKLLILITAYDEFATEFEKTLNGIEDNIKDLEKDLKVAVIIIIDGIKKFIETYEKSCDNKTFFNRYFNIDSLKEELEKSPDHEHKREEISKARKYIDPNSGNSFEIQELIEMVGGSTELAHVFCSRIQIPEKEYDLMFCIKEQNKGKLNSQYWFLKVFCKLLEPEFILFVDVGTKPQKKSIKSLYECMIKDSNVAGCCGEIIPESKNCFDILTQAQIVEYKISHILDKSFESLFGFVSVLPGAFSAYRMSSLTDKILDVYFYTEIHSKSKISLFEANMYLAEDRVLCLELFCQEEKKNTLKYVKDSKASTDAPIELHKLMAQRRRWINGSWFSSIHTIKSCLKVWKSGHSCCRKLCFNIFMVYYTIIAIFTWFLVGASCLACSLAFKRLFNETNNDLYKLTKFSTPIIMVYVGGLVSLVILSLSVKPEKVNSFLLLLGGIYGLFSIATIGLTIKYLYLQGFSFTFAIFESNLSLTMLMVIIFGFSLLMILNPDSIIPISRGLFQFLLMTGSYTNLFLIYAICNIHDVSWGNRQTSEDGKNKNEEINDQIAVFEGQRIVWLAIWILSNGVFSFLFNWTTGEANSDASKYANYLAWAMFFIIFVKILGGLWFAFRNCCCSCSKRNKVIHNK